MRPIKSIGFWVSGVRSLDLSVSGFCEIEFEV